jgi:hypothetical protein
MTLIPFGGYTALIGLVQAQVQQEGGKTMANKGRKSNKERQRSFFSIAKRR